VTLYDRVQLDEYERVEGILAETRAIHHASLFALGVNAPAELPKHESRFWDSVNRPPVDAVGTLEAAARMIAQVALAERIARRQRRRARGN
jgi:hypothetical protein